MNETMMNLPPGHDALLLLISGTKSFKCPVAQIRLDLPRTLILPSHGPKSCSGTRQTTVDHANQQTTTTAPGRSEGPMQDKKLVEVEWGFYALPASKAIFRARTYNCNLFSPVMMIT